MLNQSGLKASVSARPQPRTLLSWHSSCHGRNSLRTRADAATTTSPAVNAMTNQLPALTVAMPEHSVNVAVADPVKRPGGGGESLQSLTRLAAASQSCQVLEALSKTALLLRDQAVSKTADPATLQALFQNGYDTLVALLQALPMCPGAHSPAAVIPETCVTLFHVHNLLLQAAYASQQEFDVYTELMQAGLGLYLLKGPRSSVAFTNDQLDRVLEAVAHQDLWSFQRLLWQRMLPSIANWDSLQDFCSVIHNCELQAQAATRASAAAANAAGSTPSTSGRTWSSTRPAGQASASYSRVAVGALSSSPSSTLHLPTQQQATSAALPLGDSARTAPATAAAASVLYDKQAELGEYASLMSECIRAALEGAAARGLTSAAQPYASARQLLDVATAFDTRQRSASAPAALRYTFIPSPQWLSQVAAAGVETRLEPMSLDAAEVVQLLRDLDAMAPKPVECHGSTNRWLDAAGQAAVECAVLRHTASHAWTPQQALSVLQVLTGKCRTPPSDQLCSLVEGLLLTCSEAKQDVGFLSGLLQDAFDQSTPVEGSGSAGTCSTVSALTAAHMSLVRVALNRAIYLVGSATADASAASPSTASSRAADATGAPSWSSREFMFERYPRLLQAARRFGYPLQAFRLQEYAVELYNHLASAPGHELVLVGPEGLTRVLAAVASTPCCHDPQWAAAFERACLTLVAVQFSVGYTHPKRWLGLLEAIVADLPFPMPALAGGVKALMVRLCDSRRHQRYFWELLPLVGTLERRAAAAAAAARHLPPQQLQSHDLAASLWRPVGEVGGIESSSGRGSSPSTSGRGGSSFAGGAYRRPSPGVRRASVSWGGSGAAAASQGVLAGGSSGLRPIVSPPDLTRHLVSEEEYGRWCEDLGQRLALSMAMASDVDRVAQLSVLGISQRA